MLQTRQCYKLVGQIQTCQGANVEANIKTGRIALCLVSDCASFTARKGAVACASSPGRFAIHRFSPFRVTSLEIHMLPSLDLEGRKGVSFRYVPSLLPTKICRIRTGRWPWSSLWRWSCVACPAARKVTADPARSPKNHLTCLVATADSTRPDSMQLSWTRSMLLVAPAVVPLQLEALQISKVQAFCHVCKIPNTFG